MSAPKFTTQNRDPFEGRGDWLLTHTGKMYFVADPRPEDVCLADIAHALSLQCRYNGHTRVFYSVAEHAVLVSRVIERRWPNNPRLALMGLHHDDAEAYLGDITVQVKRLIKGFKDLEELSAAVIARAFGLPIGYQHDPIIKAVDGGICRDERGALLPESRETWGPYLPPATGADILGLPAWVAETEFLARHYELMDVIEAQSILRAG